MHEVNDNCLFRPVVSSDGEYAREGHVEGGRNPENLDSVRELNLHSEKEKVGDGKPMHQGPECRRSLVPSPFFPFPVWSWAPSPCDF